MTPILISLFNLKLGWEQSETDKGEIYYFNEKEGKSMWEHPTDEVYRKKFM